jgi:hypothetical protein
MPEGGRVQGTLCFRASGDGAAGGVTEEDSGGGASVGIHVLRARAVQNLQTFGVQDPYVKLTLLPKGTVSERSKTVPSGGSDPNFDELIRLPQVGTAHSRPAHSSKITQRSKRTHGVRLGSWLRMQLLGSLPITLCSGLLVVLALQDTAATSILLELWNENIAMDERIGGVEISTTDEKYWSGEKTWYDLDSGGKVCELIQHHHHHYHRWHRRRCCRRCRRLVFSNMWAQWPSNVRVSE